MPDILTRLQVLLAERYRLERELGRGGMATVYLAQDDTIANNIRYGRPGAWLSEVYEAGRLAGCDEFVARLSHGYATPIGERGLHLSAGQRQRVALARAFLVNPRILILDEATSCLDAESQELLGGALRLLCRGRTTFVIAHRLSTVQSADQIVMLDRGTVAEHGTPEELIAHRGQYFRLYDVRSREFPNSLMASAILGAPRPSMARDRVSVLAEGNRRGH